MFQMKKIQKNAVFSLSWREDREMARKSQMSKVYQINQDCVTEARA